MSSQIKLKRDGKGGYRTVDGRFAIVRAPVIGSGDERQGGEWLLYEEDEEEPSLRAWMLADIRLHLERLAGAHEGREEKDHGTNG